MVAPVEDEYPPPALDLARDAQDEAIRVRGGERELPVGQAEAPAQLAGHPGRVLGRHHRRHAPELPDAPGDRAHRRLGRVAGHRARVAEREVDVGVPVDVDDAGAVRLCVEQRIAAHPLRHPGHRHAEDLHRPRLLGERARARRALAEERALALHERGQARAIDHRPAPAHGGRGYRAAVGMSPPTGAVRGGHPALATALESLEQGLDALREEGRYRHFVELERPAPGAPFVRLADGSGRVVVDWCSNDYLGMSLHPDVVEAASRALAEHGVGSGGTRNIAGSHVLVRELEDELADLHSQEAALVFTSGFIANEASLRALGSLLDGLRDPLRRAQPRLDDRRHPRLARRARHLPAQRSRAPPRAAGGPAGRAAAHRRVRVHLLDGRRHRTTARDLRARRRARRNHVSGRDARGRRLRARGSRGGAVGRRRRGCHDRAGQPGQGLRDARRLHRRAGRAWSTASAATPAASSSRPRCRPRSPPPRSRACATCARRRPSAPLSGRASSRCERRSPGRRRAAAEREPHRPRARPRRRALPRGRAATARGARDLRAADQLPLGPARGRAAAHRSHARPRPGPRRRRSHARSPRCCREGQPQSRRALGDGHRALDALLRAALRLRASCRCRTSASRPSG